MVCDWGRGSDVCCDMQEASRNADELLKAEEKEKEEAEKKKQKNKKVSLWSEVD